MGVALVASAAKGLLMKCCYDQDKATACVRGHWGKSWVPTSCCLGAHA